MSTSTPAPAAPNVERLTKEQLDALPMGAVVRFLDDPGRRHVVAFKSGERVRGVDYTRWLLSDGGVFLSAVALADIGAVLHDPAPPVVDEAGIRAEAAKKAEKRRPSWHDNGVGIVQGSHWRAGYVEGYTSRAVLAVRPAPPVVDETALAAALGDLWDDGNTKGLDGWIGRDRGEGDVDQYAVMAREKAVDAALTRLQRR